MDASWADYARAARDVKAGVSSDVLDHVRAIQNAMSERVPSQGGFVVGEELRSDTVLATLETGIIRPLATVIPVTHLRTGFPMVDDTTHTPGSAFASILGGMQWNWTEEGAAITASAPAYGRDVLEAKKLAAYLPSVPDELLEDAPAFDTFARTVIPMGLGWAEDQAFIAGTGVGQPQGILNAPCAISVSRATSSTVLQADVANMITRMLPQSFKHCIWLCSPDVISKMLTFYLLIGTTPTSAATAPSAWLQGSPDDGWTLLGRPVYVTEHVPAMGTKGDLILVDPRFYVIADRRQMQIEASAVGLGFINDETNFRIISRLDGRVWLQSPVTPQNSSATVSPVVILN